MSWSETRGTSVFRRTVHLARESSIYLAWRLVLECRNPRHSGSLSTRHGHNRASKPSCQRACKGQGLSSVGRV